MPAEKERHYCNAPLDMRRAPLGEAILRCVEYSDGTLWVSNDAYANTVRFCPFCGYEAKKWIPTEGDC